MPDGQRTKIFFDGGLRPGARGIETAVVLHGRSHIRQDIGAGTSVDAEWLALIDAVRLARATGLNHIILLGDCLPVITQAGGTAKCRGHYIGHLDTYRTLVSTDLRARVRYIKRTQNLAGIVLARLHDR